MAILVGTSGYDYPHWVGRIYPKRLPAGERLGFYATLFSAVEINSTFCRLPTRRQTANWAAQVPPDFHFAVKASRYLTHVLRLRLPEEAVERMMDCIEPLGDRLGAVLVQLPPDLPADPGALDATLAAFGSAVRVAVEPRHPSWFCPDVESVLRAHGAALCRADRRGERSPDWRTADWRYLRMHEGSAAPPGCYEAEDLAALATELAVSGEELPEESPEASASSSAPDWVFFNNDGHACAPANARTFSRLAMRVGCDVPMPD